MMKRPVVPSILLSGCAVLVLAACSSAPISPTPDRIAAESRRMNEWFERKYEEQLHFSPMSLSMLGRKDLNDQLDDLSEQQEERVLRWSNASVREMESRFDRALLDEETQLSWDLWKHQAASTARGARWRANRYLFEQMDGLQSWLPTFLINFHAVDSEADMQAYIARVRAVPQAMDQALVRARASARAGIRPPKFAMQAVIEQAQKVITGAPFDGGADSALWADMQTEIDQLVTKGGISPSRTMALKGEARAALLESVLPAYRKLIDWEQQELPHGLVNPTGIGATMPNGKAYYDYRLEESTTTRLTAGQVHQIGLEEVARLRKEMTALKDKVGFAGDLKAFFHFLDTDPRFKFPNTDAGRQAYLDEATAVIENIRKVLPRYFGLLPKASLVVKRVEPFREQPGAAQHYFQGTPDGSRPGTYYVHLIDMDSMPKTELEVIAYHEGIPGHHMQISIAQEKVGIPTFRQQAGFNAYQEGWGLYAEWLAKEMPGTFTDPYSDMGRLGSEMWRAVRLVVDTGLHVKGWTEDQAVAYFLDNTPIAPAAARSEIQRYLTWPGQATGYKIGMIRIQQLRRKAEGQLGPRFDIRAFHDVVLGGGALPLDLLEQRVDQWIEKEVRGGH